MAGDWIKMRTTLDTDPAVVQISSALKADRYSTVGRLHKIWSWANEHLDDGQDVPVTAEFLDCLIDTPGFSAELRRVGWLSGRDGCLSFPNFERHNGESAKKRAQDASRKRSLRKSDKCPPVKRTKSGLEKRREEKSRGKGKSKPKRKFVRPTVEEVAAYCKERENTIDPQRWFDHYESNGWKVGKNSMSNWKAAVRTWEKNQMDGQAPKKSPGQRAAEAQW